MNKQSISAILMVLGFSAKAQSPSSNQNYVMETTVKVPGKTTTASLAGLPVGQANRTIQYFDGLGRPLQTVTWQGSASGKDLVQVFEYDALGRESKKYLPYAEQTSADGSYKTSGFGNQSSYYGFPGWDASAVKTDYPFSITKFEASPLNRVERQGFPGTSWQPGIVGTEHTTRLGYGMNNSDANYGTTGFAVRLFRANAVTTSGLEHERTLASSGFYGAGQLYLSISKDENWQASDGKWGTVEEYKDKEGRVVLKRQFNEKTGITQVLSTYYVYDELGNLSFVLPPGANPDAGVPNATLLEQFCYQYKYDGLKRMVEKKLPGKGWEFVVYNKLGQIVLTQDALQRQAREWLATKYDIQGRSIITGIYSNGSNRADIQSAVDAHAMLWEERDNANSNGVGTGYSSLAFPVNNITYYHTLSYYDDYNFYNNTFGQPNGTTQVLAPRTKGLLTGTRTAVLGTGTMLLSVSYYDDYGRAIQTKSDHHLNGTDVVDTEYNFDGSVKNSTRTHVNGTATTTIATAYTYDDMGRRKTTSQGINSAAPTVLSEMLYNEIGQLRAKKLANGLQTTNYSYNERGWLTTNDASSLFNMSLQYNAGSFPQFNSNISGQSYTNNGNNTFAYRYDKLNRLLSGTSLAMSEVLEYDLMGNITSLNRDGAGAKVYNYTDGNRLQSITGLTGLYDYDDNGNATVDGRNGVGLTYNHLSLPVTASKTGLSITYTYDATGAKLRKVSTQGTTTTTDYVKGIQYNNNVIDFIQNEEGIARNSSGTYTYEYNLTDHLGNVRVTFRDNNGTIVPLEQNNYYAFGKRSFSGANVNRYLYNGKELQEELEQYDYGARFYDPVIGRWNVVDNKSELYSQITPYAYAANTPINAIDPDGRLVIFIAGQNSGDGGTPQYWRNGGKNKNINFDIRVRNHFSDQKAMYLDGAFGGWKNTTKSISTMPSNLNADDRIAMGQAAGINAAGDIIRSLKRTNGVIVESIKIVAHSMGAAYAKGLIREIVQYAKDHPEECRGLRITEYDFAAFQQNKLSAVPGVPLYQYDNKGDIVVNSLFTIKLGSWFATENGATGHEKDTNEDGGHSIFDFIGVINRLSEGTYQFIDGKFVKKDSKDEKN